MSFTNDARFRAGMACWAAGDPFEAHERWEDLWFTLEGDEKKVLQGMIQLAAGWVKLRRGVVRGAQSLWAKGLQKLPPDPGFEPWRAGTLEALSMLERGGLEETKTRVESRFPRLPSPVTR